MALIASLDLSGLDGWDEVPGLPGNRGVHGRADDLAIGLCVRPLPIATVWDRGWDRSAVVRDLDVAGFPARLVLGRRADATVEDALGRRVPVAEGSAAILLAAEGPAAVVSFEVAADGIEIPDEGRCLSFLARWRAHARPGEVAIGPAGVSMDLDRAGRRVTFRPAKEVAIDVPGAGRVQMVLTEIGRAGWRLRREGRPDVRIDWPDPARDPPEAWARVIERHLIGSRPALDRLDRLDELRVIAARAWHDDRPLVLGEPPLDHPVAIRAVLGEDFLVVSFFEQVAECWVALSPDGSVRETGGL